MIRRLFAFVVVAVVVVAGWNAVSGDSGPSHEMKVCQSLLTQAGAPASSGEFLVKLGAPQAQGDFGGVTVMSYPGVDVSLNHDALVSCDSN